MTLRKSAVSFGLLLLLVSSSLEAIELGGKQVPKEKFRVILYMGDSCTGGWSYHSTVYAAPIEPFRSDRIWRLPCLDGRAGVTAFRWIPGNLDGMGNGLAFPVSKYLTKAYPDHYIGYSLCWNACTAFMCKHDTCLNALAKMSNEVTIVGVIAEWNAFETKGLLNSMRERRPADPQGEYTRSVAGLVNHIRTTLKLPDLPVVIPQVRWGVCDDMDPHREPRVFNGQRELCNNAQLMTWIDALPDKIKNLAVVPSEGPRHWDTYHYKYWDGAELHAQRFVDLGRARGWWVPDSKPDLEKPTAPSNLRVDKAWYRGATLVWEPATDNMAVEGYELFCDGNKVPPLQGLPTNLHVVTTVYTRGVVNDLEPGKTYAFTVRSRDYNGNVSAMSSEVKVTLPSQEVPVKLPLRVNLGGNAAGEWVADKPFRDGQDYGYVGSRAMYCDVDEAHYADNGYPPSPIKDIGKLKTTAPDCYPVLATWQTPRSGKGGSNSPYRFRVPPGNYRVTLYIGGTQGQGWPGAYCATQTTRKQKVEQPSLSPWAIQGQTVGDTLSVQVTTEQPFIELAMTKDYAYAYGIMVEQIGVGSGTNSVMSPEDTTRSRFVTVEATLLDKPDEPDWGKGAPLGLFVYRVKRVWNGQYSDNTIQVYHRIKEDKGTPFKDWWKERKVGQDYWLELEIFSLRKDLKGVQTYQAPTAKADLPIYTDVPRS